MEARWRLVETAWDLGVSRNLVTVTPDAEADRLLASLGNRRVDVTSSREALNGYQKGLCFYCFDEISVLPGDGRLGDVDHFIPWVLEREGLVRGLNGVWNLVLACRDCNRGERGKFARVPSESLLARLDARNNYLIQSHHPLRETLMLQTGQTPDRRRSFLRQKYRDALEYLHHSWEPPLKGPEVF